MPQESSSEQAPPQRSTATPQGPQQSVPVAPPTPAPPPAAQRVQANQAVQPAPTARAQDSRPRIVVLGAGVAGFRVAKEFSARRDIRVTLVAPNDCFTFLPRLTELFAQSIDESTACVMLKDAWHGEHVAQKATIVNPAEKHVVLESGSTVPYDRLVIAVGSVVNYFNTPGAQYCYPFYSEQDMRRLQEHIAGLLDADEQAGTRTFAIVGAGPTGCEVAYALSRVLEQKKAAGKILLLDRTPTILAPFPQNLREAVASVLNKRGVTFLLNTTVANVTPLGLDVVHEDGSKENIACLTTIWAAGSKPQSLAVTGVEKTGKGELPVRPTLQLVGHDDIFVAGDIAAAGSPKTAQAAVQQSDLVSRNLILSLKGKQLEPFSFNNRGVIIALEADTAGLFFGTLLKGFIARQVRDKYYRMQLGSYR